MGYGLWLWPWWPGPSNRLRALARYTRMPSDRFTRIPLTPLTLLTVLIPLTPRNGPATTP